MTRPIAEARDTHLRVGRVTVQAASAIDARRLADDLPAALRRALAGADAVPGVSPKPADRAAREIVAAIRSDEERAR